MHPDREHPLYYLEAETLLIATYVWVDDELKVLQAQGIRFPKKQKHQKATLAELLALTIFLLLQGQDLAKGYLAAKSTLKAYFPSLPTYRLRGGKGVEGVETGWKDWMGSVLNWIETRFGVMVRSLGLHRLAAFPSGKHLVARLLLGSSSSGQPHPPPQPHPQPGPLEDGRGGAMR
jgi:hypothetical protein